MRKISTTLFKLSAVAPLYLITAVINLDRNEAVADKIFTVSALLFFVSTLIFLFTVNQQKQQQIQTIKVKSISTILPFTQGIVFAYFLPVLMGNLVTTNFSAVMMFAMVNAYFYCCGGTLFHPFLMFRYEFAKAEMESGLTVMLITRKAVRDVRKPFVVQQLTEYTYIEAVKTRN